MDRSRPRCLGPIAVLILAGLGYPWITTGGTALVIVGSCTPGSVVAHRLSCEQSAYPPPLPFLVGGYLLPGIEVDTVPRELWVRASDLITGDTLCQAQGIKRRRAALRKPAVVRLILTGLVRGRAVIDLAGTPSLGLAAS
ncbi:hypothetical protein AB6813_03185 [bacterium RCC_150]